MTSLTSAQDLAMEIIMADKAFLNSSKAFVNAFKAHQAKPVRSRAPPSIADHSEQVPHDTTSLTACRTRRRDRHCRAQ
jgi:hypothetical protein